MIFHSSPVRLLPGQSCHRIWTDTLFSPSSQIESERFLGWKGRRSYNYLYLYKNLYFGQKKMKYFSKACGFPSYRKVSIFLGFFGLEKCLESSRRFLLHIPFSFIFHLIFFPRSVTNPSLAGGGNTIVSQQTNRQIKLLTGVKLDFNSSDRLVLPTPPHPSLLTSYQ